MKASTTSQTLVQHLEDDTSRDLESLLQRSQRLWRNASIATINFYFFIQDLKEKRLMEQTATVKDIISMMQFQCCSIDEMVELLDIPQDEISHYLSSFEQEEEEPFELVMCEW